MNDNGTRDLLLLTRDTDKIYMINAATGAYQNWGLWGGTVGRYFEGNHEAHSVYDLDGDGAFELFHCVSGPGRICVIDRDGNERGYWLSGDWKIGNPPLIFDANIDGVLDGYLGTRESYLTRLNMKTLTPIEQRTPWVQDGGDTAAMDVDNDGRWALFAGTGDDQPGRKGVFHRYDPITLKDVWSYFTNDGAYSAKPVLVDIDIDIDNDGQVEMVQSVTNHQHDDDYSAIYAFETDGTLL